MKKPLVVFIAPLAILTGAMIFTVTTGAADKPADKKAPATTQSAAKAVNKFCAVQGPDHTVDPDFYVTYKGTKIGFCCEDCMREFDSAPDEYIEKMKARKDFPKK
jgi:YHS domain-containing protein